MAPVANLWKPISVTIREMMEMLRTLFVAKLISCSIFFVMSSYDGLSDDQPSISSHSDSHLSLLTPEQHCVASKIIKAVVYETDQLMFQYKSKLNSGFSGRGRRNQDSHDNFHGETFEWGEIHTISITFPTNFRRNCAQIPKDGAPASRN
jgi:hypothetical protein